MTGTEQLTLAKFREDVTKEFKLVREELETSRQALRGEFAPALDFYDNINAVGQFLKWGAGIGASIVTIAVGLKAVGIL